MPRPESTSGGQKGLEDDIIELALGTKKRPVEVEAEE
jgi:hypothetical protein